MSDFKRFKREIDVSDTTGGVCLKCDKTIKSSNQTIPTRWDGKSAYCECARPTLVLSEEDASCNSNTLTDPVKPDGIRRPGEIVARHFEILDYLGSGGMSVVYKARHLLLNRSVAIKMLLPNSAHTEKLVRRLQQEAKAISKLQHENIVQVGEFGIDDNGLPYLVMDYVEGRPLSALLAERGSLSNDHMLTIGLQVVAGLAHAHAHGVVHRDIKPANIIITKTADGPDLVKIVDFGIAKIEDPNQSGRITQTGEVFGSPFYMSPEQCIGKSVDNRSDIYSVGCVLYECIFGQPPFVSESRMKTMMMQIQEEAQIKVSTCGEPMKVVLQECLAKDVSARYQSAEVLHQDLLKVKKGIVPEILKIQKRKQMKLKVAGLLAFGTICSAFLSWQFWLSIQPPADGVRLPTPNETRKWNFYSGSPADFAPGKEPPHVARPIGSAAAGDAYAEADGIDHSTMIYFNRGEYGKAIPLLEFATQTYKEGGRHYNNNPDIETAYLASSHLHLAQCYQMTSQWEKAEKNYRECLRLYNKVKLIPHLYEDAVSGYADTLEQTGSIERADKVLEEYRETGKVSI